MSEIENYVAPETAIDRLNAGKSNTFTTIQGTDQASKLANLKAITNSEAIAEHLGETIDLANFVVQSIQMVNDQTGEMEDTTRVILIDAAGKSFHAISGGLFTSLINLMDMVGHPSTWDEPIKVSVVEERSRAGRRFMTLKVA